MALSLEQLAQVAFQAGARGGDLEFLVAVAPRESGGEPAAHRSSVDKSKLSGDRGLWQINSTWDQQLLAAGIIKQKSDLFDPLTNARAAVYVLSKQGRGAWSSSSKGWVKGGNPLYGTNVQAAVAAVRSAEQKGMLGANFSSGGGGAAGSGGPAKLPSDTNLARVNSQFYAFFDLGSGVFIRFTVDDATAAGSGLAVWPGTPAERFANSVDGGSAAELTTVAQNFGSFSGFWESVLNQTIGSANPARNDPGVRKVIAEFAGRPDMSQAELENKLRATSYWNSRTEGELQWNSISEAERVARRQTTAAQMAQQWFTFGGEQVSTTDQRVTQLLEDVASGKMGIGAWTETFLKPRLGAESPWNRQVREEQIAQRARGVDIENTANQVRQTAQRWGLNWNEQTILHWATGLVDKTSSDKDLIDTFSAQAQVLYPWKDPNIETLTAATPWIDTYSRVMERDGTLQTPEIQKALSTPTGTPVWEFEKGLKQTSGWLETRNARADMVGAAHKAGQLMGFEA